MSNSTGEAERQVLRGMEHRFLEALLHLPAVLAPVETDRIRYALGFAGLHVFQPGAALRGGRTERPEVHVGDEIVAGLRARVFECFGPALAAGAHPVEVLRRVRRGSHRLERDLRSSRRRLLERNADRFSPDELDAEVGCKALVVACGGGGGAGYVHLGAFSMLDEVGLRPALIAGTSMGSIIGLFRARRQHLHIGQDLAWARGLTFERIFRFGAVRPHFGLPGLMQLHLVTALGELFRDGDGRLNRLSDLQIPYLAVVAGIRRDMLRATPEEWGRRRHMTWDVKPGVMARSAGLARAILNLVPFLQPGVARRIVIGADELTREFVAVDAAGFSSAIPGILHYDVSRHDEHMKDLLGTLLRREGVVALVDGGLVENVPVWAAREAVEAGVIGTRNAFVLGLDCFHPSWAPKLAWLWPLTRLVQMQTDAIAHHADRLVSYADTPFPLDLLLDDEGLTRAMATGGASVEERLGFVRLACAPARWVD